MSKKKWSFELDGETHTVELDHGTVSGRKKIWLNGNFLPEASRTEKKIFDTGGHFPFKIGSHDAVVRITTNGLWFKRDLIVDGKSLSTGKIFSSEDLARDDFSVLKKNASIAKPIRTREDAMTQLKESSKVFLVLSSIQLVLGVLVFLFGSRLLEGAPDKMKLGMSAEGLGLLLAFSGLIYFIFGFLLRKTKSRIVAILLCILIGLEFLFSLLGGVGGVGGIFIKAVLLWMAIRCVKATFKLNKPETI